MSPNSPSAYIATLDPRTDYEEIVRLLSTVVFPWEVERSLEFALYRTYAVPAISGLLAATGEFIQRTRKRYDDTELLLAEVMENGFNSERGRQAIDRINAMHECYSIANDDYLYVLSTFVFEPIRWLRSYGWRPLTAREQEAWFLYYRRLGASMNIYNLPESLADFEIFNCHYEAERFDYAESNRVIATATRDLFLGFYLPKLFWRLGRPGIYAMLDNSLLEAFRFPKPNRIWRWLLPAALRLRARGLRYWPQNTRPRYITTRPRPTYPMGYAIAQLGTFAGDDGGEDKKG